MKRFVSEEENFEFSSEFDKEPVKLLKGWSNMLYRRNPGYDMSSRILNPLEFIEKLEWQTK